MFFEIKFSIINKFPFFISSTSLMSVPSPGNTDDDVKRALLAFCNHDLKIRDLTQQFRKQCEPATAERNRASAQLVKIMNEDGVDVMELRSGAFLCRKVVKTMVALSDEVVRDAITVVLGAHAGLNTSVSTLAELIQGKIQESRISLNTSIVVKDRLPRDASDQDVKVASAYVSDTTQVWVDSREFLTEARKANALVMKSLVMERDKMLCAGNVRTFIKDECGDGKVVILPGREDEKFKLRYSVSRRQNPVREVHVKEGVMSAMKCFLKETSSMPHTTEGITRLATIVVEMTRENAGVTTAELYSLSAQPGRKRKNMSNERVDFASVRV